MKKKQTSQKLSVEEFVLRAIDQLAGTNKKTGERWKTIHVVYSYFNQAFKEYFKEEGLDPIAEVNKLVEAGKIERRFVRGGAIIGRPGAIKDVAPVASALEKMGL